MNSIAKDNEQVIHGNGSKGARAANPRREPGSAEVHDLMAEVQDLLGQMAHVADPEIARMRAKVSEALDAAKQAVADGAQRVQRQAKSVMQSSDGYVRNQPWQALGVAAVVGVVVGILVARR
jgi:ElaB/YqjD/DUF883 family membrane-anchored ribosome-binding protein